MKDFKISPMDFISTPTNAVADLCSVLLHNPSANNQGLGPSALNASRISCTSAVNELRPFDIIGCEYAHLFFERT
jgi:hypothetical protein